MRKLFLILFAAPLLFLGCSSEGGNDNHLLAGTTWLCNAVYNEGTNTTIEETITFVFSDEKNTTRSYVKKTTVMVGGTPVTTSESYVNAGKYKLEVDVSRLTVDFTLEDGESKYRYMYIYTGEKFYMNDGPIRYNFNKISQ